MKYLALLFVSLIIQSQTLFAQEKLKISYEVTPYYELAVKESMELVIIPSLHELLINGSESQYDYVERVNNSQKDPMSGSFATM